MLFDKIYRMLPCKRLLFRIRLNCLILHLLFSAASFFTYLSRALMVYVYIVYVKCSAVLRFAIRFAAQIVIFLLPAVTM